MLTCQRALFDLPRDIAYLNAASYSPLPLATQVVAHAAVANKGRPWRLAPDFIQSQNEGVRAAAARLINAAPSDVALISSVGYGVATAAKVLDVARGSRVVVLADDHSSPVLEWHVRAAAQGFTVDTVPAPADRDWTSAILDRLSARGAAPVSIVSISSVHWADGALIDMARVAPAVRATGAALLVDATQGAGVVPIDVAAMDPDFLVFPTYKWLLGPYGRAFLYVAKRRQTGIPLEQTAHGRRDVRAENSRYLTDLAYTPDARRYDMGERDHFLSIPMTAASLDLINALTPAAIGAYIRPLTARLADGLADLPVTMTPASVRTPHVLSLGFPRGMPDGLQQTLARANVFAAVRLGRLRLSPHVYNDAADIDRAVAALREALAP